EYKTALTFLRALTGELGIEGRRVVVVPGNHDVSWTACKRVVLDQEDEGFDDDELRRRLGQVKLQRFIGFLRQLYAVDDLTEVAAPLGRDAFIRDFRELGLSVAALNSCEAESHLASDHYGLVSREQAQAVLDRWRRDSTRAQLRIICVHHNPNGFPSGAQEQARQELHDLCEAGRLGSDEIDRFVFDLAGCEGRDQLQQIAAQCQVQLVLHGHQHELDQQSWPWPENGMAHVLGAGALGLRAGKLPGDETASARLIRLDPQEGKLQAYSLRYQSWTVVKGQVATGSFSPDREGYRQALSLPDGWRLEASQQQAADDQRGELAAFVRAYRERLDGAHARWDPASAGVITGGGGLNPIEAELDEMYVPLRLAEGFELSKTDLGTPLADEALLARSQPLVIRGQAGSGKTTWMRWTFRRLLRDERAVPLLVVLRDLARHWSEPGSGGDGRTIEAYLEHDIASHLGSGWEGRVRSLLADGEGPRPVLLIDGWDELGDLGEQLRTRLVGLIKEFPWVTVVVSSRPYGSSRPSSGEGFQVLDIQPLNDGEIELLARRFSRRCHGDDTAAAERQAASFGHALEAAAEARTLARTALLLTMMLLI
ncbi:MAG: NACHT domain-containing protein, partial [Delftia sp.]|nr:NACHT domain-containing protein [Delftia sp.]